MNELPPPQSHSTNKRQTFIKQENKSPQKLKRAQDQVRTQQKTHAEKRKEQKVQTINLPFEGKLIIIVQ